MYDDLFIVVQEPSNSDVIVGMETCRLRPESRIVFLIHGLARAFCALCQNLVHSRSLGARQLCDFLRNIFQAIGKSFTTPEIVEAINEKF